MATSDRVKALMKRCQIGVGGRDALEQAHSIMADCYGTLGALSTEIATLRSGLEASRAAHGMVVADRDHMAAENERLRAQVGQLRGAALFGQTHLETVMGGGALTLKDNLSIGIVRDGLAATLAATAPGQEALR